MSERMHLMDAALMVIGFLTLLLLVMDVVTGCRFVCGMLTEVRP